jgi:hypothetical protein
VYSVNTDSVGWEDNIKMDFNELGMRPWIVFIWITDRFAVTDSCKYHNEHAGFMKRDEFVGELDDSTVIYLYKERVAVVSSLS